MEYFFLGGEGGVLETDELAGEECCIDVFEKPEDGKVVGAADIDAQKEVVWSA